jgi:CGNR zinc finger protein/putative stress-induced transcription regulator
METRRLPQPVHQRDTTAPAPGELEQVRGFLSLHDHEPGNPDSLPPSSESLRWWLTSRGLVDEGQRVRRDDLNWALRVRAAMRSKVRENMGERRDPSAIAVLNGAAEETGLRLCFGCPEDVPIHVDATGVRGAIGTLLGTAFLAELDGRWERFRICNDPGCSAVFYDRSRNRTGKWCSMASCGNRAKVRAFRERQAAG